jgi:hypothetical protein
MQNLFGAEKTLGKELILTLMVKTHTTGKAFDEFLSSILLHQLSRGNDNKCGKMTFLHLVAI